MLIHNKLMEGQYQADYSQEKAFFSDYLYQVTGEQLKQPLHKSIIAITSFDHQNARKIGSGVLISRDTILTAASNIYNRETRREFEDLKVFVSFENQANQYQKINRWVYPEEFKKCTEQQKVKFDYAIIILNRTVLLDKYLRLSIPCHSCFFHHPEKAISVFGSTDISQTLNPRYQTHKDNFYQQGLSSIHTDMMIDWEESRIQYHMSTISSQIGSPVIMQDEIIAINLDTGKGLKNVGRVIDNNLINNLMTWQGLLKTGFIVIKQQGVCATVQLMIRKIKQYQKMLVVLQNSIQNLSLQGYFNIKELDLSDNLLKTIDLSCCPYLLKAKLVSNLLTQINLVSNSHLTQIDLKMNQLQQVNLSSNLNLTHIFLSNNKIQEINVKHNIKLVHLSMWNNRLCQIDVSFNVQLTQLYLSNNKLQKINLNKNYRLKSLSLDNNKIMQIDLTNNCQLSKLWLQRNELSLISLAIPGKRLSQLSKLTTLSQTNLFSLSNQLSPSCKVELVCEGEDANSESIFRFNMSMHRPNKGSIDQLLGLHCHQRVRRGIHNCAEVEIEILTQIGESIEVYVQLLCLVIETQINTFLHYKYQQLLLILFVIIQFALCHLNTIFSWLDLDLKYSDLLTFERLNPIADKIRICQADECLSIRHNIEHIRQLYMTIMAVACLQLNKMFAQRLI